MFALKLISRLPFRILYRISDFIFFVLFYVVKYRKKVVCENLRKSFPEKSETEIETIARDFFLNLSDIIVEVIKSLTISEKELKKRVSIEGEEPLQKLIREGKTGIVMSNHLCNWELVPLRSALSEVNSDVIYKPLKSEFFEKFMFTIRSRFGVFPVPMKMTLREVVRRKNIPRIIGMVADQVPGIRENAYWTDFLNQDTDFFMGSERIARSNNYPVFYGELSRKKRGFYHLKYHTLIEPPYDHIPPNGITELYVRTLEKSICQYPSDWLWSHKRFKHTRPENLVQDHLK
ncbi:KDO2-lipid IV(A) lauroyltransferase [Pseudarcicella hirudinis]|uniref:KDO2-lipid IV(A) lauroyltransferase n=1 Tax=Pseudarcicella hirudinis TaxID=1079859 RepID=A0A1I5SRX4_9BACT|nr:lysophospholipid acyltransferase family protein [Pseudarcicella hirudinis]SFP73544.1 KDO2-lipid IV(A) lauroyltransferase [Pseudarcicella hirudinis]